MCYYCSTQSAHVQVSMTNYEPVYNGKFKEYTCMLYIKFIQYLKILKLQLYINNPKSFIQKLNMLTALTEVSLRGRQKCHLFVVDLV